MQFMHVCVVSDEEQWSAVKLCSIYNLKVGWSLDLYLVAFVLLLTSLFDDKCLRLRSFWWFRWICHHTVWLCDKFTYETFYDVSRHTKCFRMLLLRSKAQPATQDCSLCFIIGMVSWKCGYLFFFITKARNYCKLRFYLKDIKLI